MGYCVHKDTCSVSGDNKLTVKLTGQCRFTRILPFRMDSSSNALLDWCKWRHLYWVKKEKSALKDQATVCLQLLWRLNVDLGKWQIMCLSHRKSIRCLVYQCKSYILYIWHNIVYNLLLHLEHLLHSLHSSRNRVQLDKEVLWLPNADGLVLKSKESTACLLCSLKICVWLQL